MFQRTSHYNIDCEWNFEQLEAERMETGCWAWRAHHTWSAPSAVLILLKCDCWFWSALQSLQKYLMHQVWVLAIYQQQGACHSFITALFSRCPFCGEASGREGARRVVRGEVWRVHLCAGAGQGSNPAAWLTFPWTWGHCSPPAGAFGSAVILEGKITLLPVLLSRTLSSSLQKSWLRSFQIFPSHFRDPNTAQLGLICTSFPFSFFCFQAAPPGSVPGVDVMVLTRDGADVLPAQEESSIRRSLIWAWACLNTNPVMN